MVAKGDKRFFHICALIFILILAFLVRLYFFDAFNEITNSDEGEYLVMSKSFAENKVLFQWPYLRSFLLPLFWGFLMKLGLGLFAIRITLIIFSLLSIFLVYLITKELFDYRVGLLASFFMVFFPDEILHSNRILLNSAALSIWLLSIYFFQRAYFRKSDLCLYLCSFSTGLAILLYTQNIALLPIYFLFLFSVEGKSFVRNKKYLFFFLIPLLVYSFIFLYSYIWFGDPLKSFVYGLWNSLIDTNSRNYFSLIIDFARYIPKYFSWFYVPFLLFVFIIIINNLSPMFKFFFANVIHIKRKILMGLFVLVSFFVTQHYLDPFAFNTPKFRIIVYFLNTLLVLFFGFILLYIFRSNFYSISWRIKSKSYVKKNLFLICWIIFGFFSISRIVGAFQARYFIHIIVPIFIYFSSVIFFLYSKSLVKKYVKSLYILLVLSILLFGGFSNFFYADQLVNSYENVGGYKDLGSWLAMNTDQEDIIFGPRNFALVYYSSRSFYVYPLFTTLGSSSYNEFLLVIKELKPKFIVLDDSTPEVLRGVLIEKYFYIKFIEGNVDRVERVYSTTNSYGYQLLVYRVHYDPNFD